MLVMRVMRECVHLNRWIIASIRTTAVIHMMMIIIWWWSSYGDDHHMVIWWSSHNDRICIPSNGYIKIKQGISSNIISKGFIQFSWFVEKNQWLLTITATLYEDNDDAVGKKLTELASPVFFSMLNILKILIYLMNCTGGDSTRFFAAVFKEILLKYTIWMVQMFSNAC